MLDSIYNIQISTGSACNNGESVPSSALLAIGMENKYIHSCIRISFSGYENKEELINFCNALLICIKILNK